MPIRRLMVILALTLSTLPALPAPPEKVAAVEGITEYRLDNGLRVLLYRETSRPTVTVNLTVLVGSRHEGYGESGMAHLLEHMLFKGTEKHPKIFQLLTGRGAQFNGSTSADRTNYYETLPATDDNLEFMIAMEADRMMNSPVKAEELASEFSVVRNEFERGENSPQRILSQRMYAAAFEWHNYGKTTIGNRSDIERVPVENLRAFYKKYYQPDNAVVIVAGRFDEKRALELVEKHFGAIPRPARKLDKTYTEEPPQDGERIVTLRRVGDVPAVGLLYHVPAGADPEFAAVDVLARVLSEQPSGVLYKALVETKKASRVNASARPGHDPGAITISCDVRPGEKPEEIRDIMFRTIDQFIASGTTKEEVDRVVQRYLKQREILATNTSQFAVNLSEWAAQGDWRLFFLHRDRMEKVTPDDVKAVASKYLKPANRTVGMFLPTDAPDRVAVAPAPDVAAMLKDYKGKAELAAGEDFDASPANIEARTKLLNIPGTGIKAALLPKKTRGQTVQLRLTLRYGDENSLKGYVESAGFLPDLMARATKKLSRQALADALDASRTTLTADGGAGRLTISMQTRRPNVPAALDLLRQVLREPALPEGELDILKRAALARLEQDRTQPTALVDNAIARKLRAFDRDDVRYQPTIEEQVERTKGVTIEKVKKLYDDFVGSSQGELVVVGDFDEAALAPAMESMLRDWQPKTPYARIAMPAAGSLPAADVAIPTPDKANAQYGAAFSLPTSDAATGDYPALLMVNRVLGGSGTSRLWVRVRETEGLSYGVRSYLSASPLDSYASLTISAIVNPANMPKLKTVMDAELRKLLEQGVTDQELKRAQDSWLEQRQVSRSQDAALAGLLAEHLYAGRSIRYEADLEEKVRALTPDQVLAAAKKYLNLGNLVVVTAGDFQRQSQGAGAAGN
jgi:zinc protease